MRIHFISIGGAAMHNLALALQKNGHQISGSDDEIYDPSRSRLEAAGLLPQKMGWDADRITTDLDFCLLGMHARPDNPELARAIEMGIPVHSYPSFLYNHSKSKTRLVVAGSHGKTTTTSIIMHVLKYLGKNYDYLVGAQLEGFDTMVRLSDAPLMVIEGDEYLSSPIDRRPKILHYKPQIAIITGIAWDHINVFPTFENYLLQFELFIKDIKQGGYLIFDEKDEHLKALVKKLNPPLKLQPYRHLNAIVENGQTILIGSDGSKVPIHLIGDHNLANLNAALLACEAIGVSEKEFLEAMPSFQGAAKRLQKLAETADFVAYQDFAHAPSKVKATITAMKKQFPERHLVAALELHTFSSLNKKFLTEYKNAANEADTAIVFFSEHTLKMKKLPPISKADIQQHFNHPNLVVLNERNELEDFLKKMKWKNRNLLMMSSGTFGGLNYKLFANSLI